MGNLLSHVRFFDLSEATGIRYESLFDSIEGWTQYVQGGGLIGLVPGEVDMSGGIGAGDYAILNKFLAVPHWSPVYSQKRKIKSNIQFSFKSGGSDDNFFGTGFYPVPGQGFGFRYKSDGIYGYVTMDPDYSEVGLITELVAPWEQVAIVEATFFPGSRVQFTAFDGLALHVGNITDLLPEGDDFSGVPIGFQVSQGGATAHTMIFSSCLFFQDI